jgi:hypothetical protein
MPKEQITYPGISTSEPETSESEPVTVYNTSLSLHWDNNTVQLGVTIDVKSLSEYLDAVKKDSPTDRTIDWYTVPITRPELNKLIRTARRARDAAYGEDE